MSGVIVTPVVYAVRPGDSNQELRYSLRSLTNLDHDRVIIAGHTPPWVTNVESLTTTSQGSKHENAARNWDTAARHLTEPFLMFNDDFYVMRPTTVQVWHRGPLAELIAYYQQFPHREYLAGMQRTATLLAQLGVKEPLSYGLHIPMLIDPKQWLAMGKHTKRATGPIHLRTLYGNLHNIGGTYRDDVKTGGRRNTFNKRSDFLSTSDKAFMLQPVGEWVRSKFIPPCLYETPPSIRDRPT